MNLSTAMHRCHGRSLVGFVALGAVVTLASAALAEQHGVPLSATLSVRGPLAHLVSGASFVTQGGAVLPTATASIDGPPGAVIVFAQVTWVASGAQIDNDIALLLPDGRGGTVRGDVCTEVDAGTNLSLHYWSCRADITALLAGHPVAGDVVASEVVVETGPPWSFAQGFVGAFALVIVYADPADTTPRMLQVADGLLWSKTVRTSSPALLAFASAASAGRLSVVAVEGDAELPGDGECTGVLTDASCDFVGLCRGEECTPLVVAQNAANPPGQVFNESSGDALDIDSFDLAGQLPPGSYDDVRSFVQTGSDAVLHLLAVVQVDDLDSDGDGLADAVELELGTQVADPDSDGDGIADGAEFYGRSPADPRSTPTDPLDSDSDGDGLNDGAEDSDHDGLRDGGETSAAAFDTDGDGLGDGLELQVANYPGPDCFEGHSDPIERDSDSDGRSDGSEDQNADGIIDGAESSPCTFDARVTPVGEEQVPLPIPEQREPFPLVPGDVVVTIIPPHAVAVPERPVQVVVDPHATGRPSGSTIWGCSSLSRTPASAADAFVLCAAAALVRVRRRRA